MYEPAPLSSEQLAEFDVNGALVLKGLLDPAMCADMRGQYWRLLEVERPGGYWRWSARGRSTAIQPLGRRSVGASPT